LKLVSLKGGEMLSSKNLRGRKEKQHKIPQRKEGGERFQKTKQCIAVGEGLGDVLVQVTRKNSSYSRGPGPYKDNGRIRVMRKGRKKFHCKRKGEKKAEIP